jgi:anti-sigma factor (TIGR02949 family)
MMLKNRDSCRSASAFLMDYVEGRLDAETVGRFDEHIDACPNCRRYLDQYCQTITLVKEVPTTTVPAELEERTCAFIMDALDVDPGHKH